MRWASFKVTGALSAPDRWMSPGMSERRTLVVTNPSSRQNRRGFERLAAAITAQRGFEHVVMPGLDALASLARDWPDPDVLAVNGGDGTVHYLLTALHVAGITLPRLALLPGGTTNMTARDLSGRRSHEAALQRLLASPGAVVRRSALKVTDLASGDVQVGFFFGAGSIVSGIRFTHERVYRIGIGDELAPGLALLRVVWGMARGRGEFAAATPARIQADGESIAADAWALVVTPLRRLFLGLHPFWNLDGRPLQLTLMERGAHRPLTNLPRLLVGRPGPEVTPRHGYHSFGVEELQLGLDGPYTLDGELYPPPAAGLRLEAFGPLEFLGL